MRLPWLLAENLTTGDLLLKLISVEVLFMSGILPLPIEDAAAPRPVRRPGRYFFRRTAQYLLHLH